MGKKIAITTFGSFGDIHPYMAIALELLARGHEPVIATMSLYREKIEAAGLSFAPVRPDVPPPQEQDQNLVEKIMEPRSGPRFLIEEVFFPALRDSYQDLLKIAKEADLLITHPVTFAGPLVGYKLGIRWISTVLAPTSFMSAYDPPVPPFWPWMVNVKHLGPHISKLVIGLAKRGFNTSAVARLREELALSDYGNPLFEGQHSPKMVLALFSSVLASPQPDWPPQTQVTGFAFYDEDSVLPPQLAQFLDQGEAPVVFTLGSSAVWVAQDFFAESIEAARKLGRRAVLLIGDDRNLPALTIPDDIIAVNYAPYQVLFPRACAVVHHGGVGTTSQGLRAGVPTLIVPFAFDQSDNAARAARLGVSKTLYRSKYSASTAAKELAGLLANPGFAEKAKRIRRQLQAENGAAAACDLIEKVLDEGNKSKREDRGLSYASGS